MITVKKSKVHGRGIFAKKNINRGTILEKCPILIIKNEEIKNNSIINNYLFSFNDKSKSSLLALGLISLINHNNDPNVETMVDDKIMILKAIKNIKKGEELFLSYGENWFSSRK